jgi:hypothetical protein
MAFVSHVVVTDSVLLVIHLAFFQHQLARVVLLLLLDKVHKREKGVLYGIKSGNI